MAQNRNYRDYPRSLTANEPMRLGVRGDYWEIISAPLGSLKLEFDQGMSVTREEGTGGPADYTEVIVTSAVTQDVILSLGYIAGMAPYNARANVTGTVNAVAEPATLNPAGADVTVAAGTQELVAAANPDRKELRLECPPTADDYIRWGDISVSAVLGNKLYPGQVEYIATEAAVYVWNPNAADVDVGVGELERP